MDAKSRMCLIRNRQALEKDIKTSYIMDCMVADQVLTLQEEEEVKLQNTQKERAAMLINTLLTKDNNAYRSFYNALLHEGYRDLAALLQDGIPVFSSRNGKNAVDEMTSYVKTTLCEGGVPQRPVVFVTRPKLVDAIKQKLCSLGSDPGWVTVYGMAGCGKTVLTAEALRDHQLLEGYFPGGVHWISVGKQDKAGLLIKLQNLCSRLEHDSALSQRPPLNIEEAKDRLRLLMLRKYPRSLLVLDDIWDSWVLKAFDNQCQVLITSRDRSVTDAVSGNKYEVHVESGLTHEKGLEVLALFVNMKISELPEQANCIVRECKGSPLVISLIGALLRDFPSRWEYYLKQLQNKQFKRIRKSSSYDYEALDEAMSISVEQLSNDLKDYYKDLSILPKDVKVPTKVLCILWDMETEEVEDILQEFVNKSLLFCDRNGNSFHYYLHDLQLDFLTEKNHNQLQELHKNIVNQYKKYYKLHVPVLSQEDCMYWYNFLAYHMAGANMQKELRDLMFSLDWIKAKTELVGPAHLIHEYVEYSSVLDQKDSVIRENFQEFLSLNGHLLGRQPFPDIIQLGLCQSETSEVYQQAKLRAQREMGTFYLEWINKKSLKNLSRLVVRPHKDAVYHACFSRDRQRIASCGADKTLQVFKAESGERLLEISAHDDEILCCTFSADDKYVATCSADKKVKLWDVNSANELKTIEIKDFFRNADEQQDDVEVLVKCCSWSRSGDVILVVAKNKLLLFDVTTCDLLTQVIISHHSTIQYCDFCAGDELVAVALSHCSVELINGNTDSIIIQTEPQESLICCCCLSEDLKFAAFGQENGAIKVWNWQLNECVFLRGHKEAIKDFALLENSKLLSWSFDGTVKIWSFESSSVLHELRGHEACVRCSAFSPNNKLLATGDDKGDIRIWDILTGKLLHFCSSVTVDEGEPTHGGWVTDLSFSPDSKMLVSSGGYLKWWDVTTGESLQTFYTNGTNLKSIHVSPNFEVYVTVDSLGILYVLRKL
ncbi:hypothetical protein ASZ78_005300 [Callipepla squamata]|uniref:CARD domain-containing protein n=1 Tax=Callipepla squamata TaxID=9009 RepID=A0A226NC50_CALSU|nr:hypothetical protein ASZ78_005300 [Callipepla squamata]